MIIRNPIVPDAAIVRETGPGVEMVQRSKPDAIREAYAQLQAGHFAAARQTAAPWVIDPSARLLHALAQAASGDIAAAPALAAIAQANPAARHPVFDLAGLLDGAGPLLPHAKAAVEQMPTEPALQTLLGQCNAEAGDMQAAIQAFKSAARLAPGQAANWSNLAKALAAAGRFAEAEPAFARATALAPQNPQFTLNHAIARLKSGDMPGGWPLFRARHRLPGRAPPPAAPELRTLEGVAGTNLLLLHDEGFGDTIQFLRYAPLLEALGARVAVQVPKPLARLLAARGFRTAPPSGPWIRIPDLPALFGTTLETIPPPLPLRADPACAAQWAQRLPPGRRVGLVWAGAARLHNAAAAATDRLRSIPAHQLAPLLQTPAITWISLQKDHPAPPGVFNPMQAVQDFAGTAAIIANLESVVTVDTAVAHLAASMGRPVLLLDRYDNCWRWLTARSGTPWYPTMQILRQPTPGNWNAVLARAAESLA